MSTRPIGVGTDFPEFSYFIDDPAFKAARATYVATMSALPPAHRQAWIDAGAAYIAAHAAIPPEVKADKKVYDDATTEILKAYHAAADPYLTYVASARQAFLTAAAPALHAIYNPQAGRFEAVQ
jgi:hypothetical protein